jgi:DNA-binding NarL/FixJ family response regulator
MEEIHVTIFDDNKNIRDAMSMLLSGTPGFILSGVFPDCDDLIENIAESDPDVVLMDIDMPGMNGIDAVKKIRETYHSLNILMLTGFADDEKVFASICAGANGYVLKNTPPAKLIEFITDVYHGGAPMTPAIARKVLVMFQDKNINEKMNEIYRLTPREKDVLTLLTTGKVNKQIASDLNISFETVHSHLKKIYEKLHVTSKTEAVAKALQQRLI